VSRRSGERSPQCSYHETLLSRRDPRRLARARRDETAVHAHDARSSAPARRISLRPRTRFPLLSVSSPQPEAVVNSHSAKTIAARDSRQGDSRWDASNARLRVPAVSPGLERWTPMHARPTGPRLLCSWASSTWGSARRSRMSRLRRRVARHAHASRGAQSCHLRPTTPGSATGGRASPNNGTVRNTPEPDTESSAEKSPDGPAGGFRLLRLLRSKSAASGPIRRLRLLAFARRAWSTARVQRGAIAASASSQGATLA
jgi:hypothetical protein